MKEGNNRISYIAVLFLMVFVMFGLSGCGSTGGMNDGETTVTPTETVKTVTLQVADTRLLSDGTSTTKITAIVENSDGSRMSRSAAVTFSTTAGTLSATSAKTVNGVASVTLTSSTSIETATIKAASEGVSADSATVEFTAIPMSFSLLASQNSVKSDNSDTITITATVQDVKHVAIEGIPVQFAVDGGQMSSDSVDTDENGKAQITFSAGGVDKTNRTVSVTATVSGLVPKTIPIQISGTEVGLVSDTSSIDIETGDIAKLTITVKDAGLSSIFDAVVTATVIPGVPGNPDIEQGGVRLRLASDTTQTDTGGVLTGKTNISGQLVMEVIGTKAGQVTVQVSSLGDTKTINYVLNSTANTFAIIQPSTNPVAVSISEELTVVVRSPSRSPVQFSTTFGVWNGQSQVIEVPVDADGTASAKLTAPDAGAANVQVFDLGDTTRNTSDSLQVFIAASPDTATQLSLQASPSVVAPSTGDVVNTSVITATVKNAKDQVVGNAPIAFSLEDTTGGGEFVSPVVVYTNSSGVATTTFQSGSLPSSAQGVTIKAVVLLSTQTVTDSVKIKIGGVAGSVVISRGTTISTTDDNTAYIQPMAVLVADANGNPVSGAKVTLGTWPSQYATGFWESDVPCDPVVTGTFPNEDVNRNLVLDPGEDKNNSGDIGYGELTPPNSAAGSVAPADTETSTGNPSYILETGADGLASFNLVYLKNSAVWIEDEITASTIVAGSETRSTYKLWLPYIADEACNLPHSPYGTGGSAGKISLSTNKTQLLANGKSEAELTAILTDIGGNLASLGTGVEFEVISGGGGFPSKTTSSSVGDTGGAVVTYIAPKGVSEGSTVQIRATAIEYGTSNIITITLGEGGMIFTASPTTLLATGSSSEISIITATILDMNDNPVEGEVINFRVTEIAKGGLASGTGGIDISSEISLTSGISGAVSLYFFPYNTGSTTPVEITATAPDMAVTQSVTITLLGEQVGAISLAPDETDIPVGGFSTSIEASLTGTSGNPMPLGTPVTFSTTKGTLSPSSNLQVSNDSGTVTVTLISDATPGAAIVTCSSGGVSQAVAVNFTSEGTETTVASMELAAADASIPATSGSSTNITATVKDSKGAAVAGAEITFSVSSNAKLFPSTSTVVADSTGVATVQLIAQGTAGDAEVTATAGTVSKRVVVKLTTAVGSIELKPAAESISAKTGSSTIITATIKDIAGKVVPAGTEVTFATTLGKISPQTTVTTTDATGIVTVSLVAEGTAGLANVTATSGGVSNNTSVTFTASPSGAAVGEEFGLRFLGWDAESSNICANVGDVFGNPVSDGTLVYFKTYNTGGWIEPASKTTASGEACVMLHYDPLGNTAPVNDTISVTAETQGGLTTHITSIAATNESGNPFNHIVYAGTDGSGVYKSTNSGQTWQTVSRSTSVAGQNWIDPYINDIVIDPYNSNIIYAATGYLGKGNIFRSLDGGQNWNSNNSFETNGIYEIDFAITTILIDDDNTIDPETEAPYVWIGTNGNGLGTLLFDDYHSTPQSVNKGTKLSSKYWENSRFFYVHDIVKVPGSHRESAILYAATSIGVYKSSNGGSTWTKLDKPPFTGYYTNTLEIHPSSSGADNDVIYAGTRDGSVWVTTDSGQNWTQYINGFTQADNNGRYIRDLLVDAKNNRLYAVTYYKTEQMDYAVGNIYSHELKSNGSMETGDWEPAGTGLPTHSGGVIAQYAIASLPDTSGNAANPTGLLTGGDQLSLYRANSAGLQTGIPAWSESDSGFTNIIMARIAVAIPTPATSVSFAGSGDGSRDFYCSGGKVDFTMSHDGSELFRVALVNLSDSDEIPILLVSQKGTVTDEVSTTYLNMGNYSFVVEADGNWTVNVKGNIVAN